MNWAIKSGIENTSKTCMILCGSIAEALLLERLTQNANIENQAILIVQALPPSQKPFNPNDLESWSLVTLIVVAEKLGLIPSDIEAQIGQLRDWRNLIHPGKEVKTAVKKRIKISKERAENAIGFLKLLACDINY